MHMDDIVGWPEAGPARFDGPTLFLAGERSPYVLPEHQGEIRRLFPNARLEAVPGAGHWVHVEQPDAFLRQLAAFLD